jgi:hypothetical protein
LPIDRGEEELRGRCIPSAFVEPFPCNDTAKRLLAVSCAGATRSAGAEPCKPVKPQRGCPATQLDLCCSGSLAAKWCAHLRYDENALNKHPEDEPSLLEAAYIATRHTANSPIPVSFLSSEPSQENLYTSEQTTMHRTEPLPWYRILVRLDELASTFSFASLFKLHPTPALFWFAMCRASGRVRKGERGGV